MINDMTEFSTKLFNLSQKTVFDYPLAAQEKVYAWIQEREVTEDDVINFACEFQPEEEIDEFKGKRRKVRQWMIQAWQLAMSEGDEINSSDLAMQAADKFNLYLDDDLTIGEDVLIMASQIEDWIIEGDMALFADQD